MNEAETRAEHIDPALAAGWGVVEGSRIRREYPIALDDIRKKGRGPKNGSLFFTIFQIFMSGEGEIEAGKRYSTPWLARYSS